MYRALGLLQKDSNFDLDIAAARVVAKIPGSSASRTGDTVTISKGAWSMFLAIVSGPHIGDETIGITDKIAGLEQAEAEAAGRVRSPC